MRCPKCTNEIPNDSKICPICQNIFATYFEEIKLTKKQKIELLVHKILFPTIIITLMIIFITYKITKNRIKNNRITDVNNLVINEKTYINELYISDQRHYTYILTKEEKELYDTIIEAIKNYKTIIEVRLDSSEESEFIAKKLRNVKKAISMDHPELIELKDIIYTTNDKTINIKYEIESNEKENKIIEIKQKIEEIKEQTRELSDYEKIKYVYNDLAVKEETKETSSSAICILEKNCNDQGYAKISQIIFQNIKINSILVTGAKNHKYHEWNIVKIEGEYYNFDLSCEKNKELTYEGLLFKNKDYSISNQKLIPKIKGKKYLNKETK